MYGREMNIQFSGNGSGGHSCSQHEWMCLGCSGSVYMTACSRSCQYPAASHSHWRGHFPQATINNLFFFFLLEILTRTFKD